MFINITNNILAEFIPKQSIKNEFTWGDLYLNTDHAISISFYYRRNFEWEKKNWYRVRDVNLETDIPVYEILLSDGRVYILYLRTWEYDDKLKVKMDSILNNSIK